MPTHIRQIDKNNCIALVNAVRRLVAADLDKDAAKAFADATKKFLPGGSSEDFGIEEQPGQTGTTTPHGGTDDEV